MEWEDSYKIDLLQTEMDRIASTNARFQELDRDRRQLMKELEGKLGKNDRETLAKLVDVIEIQNFIMIRSLLRIGLT